MPDSDASAKSGPIKPSGRGRSKADDGDDADADADSDAETKEDTPGMSVPDQQQLVARLLRRYGTGRSR